MPTSSKKVCILKIENQNGIRLLKTNKTEKMKDNGEMFSKLRWNYFQSMTL